MFWKIICILQTVQLTYSNRLQKYVKFITGRQVQSTNEFEVNYLIYSKIKMHRRSSLLRVFADTFDVFWIQSIKHPVFQHRKLNGALLFHQVFVSVWRNVQKTKN